MSAEATLKMLLLGEDRSLSKTLKGAGDAAEATGKRMHGMSGLVKGLIAGAAAAGIVKFGKDSVDAFKNVGSATLSMQRKIGGTPQEVSRLNFAFHETGVATETAQKGLGIFEKNLVSSTAKSKTTGAMIKNLGFDFRDAHGHVKPMTDILPQLADKFQKMPAGAEKTALAMKLFGKSGAEMLPFLNKGSAGIAELERESDKLGHTLTGKDLAAIKENKKAHREWSAAVEGVKIQFGAQLLPILNQFMQFLIAKGVPAVALFTKGMQSGTGPGGQFRNMMTQVGAIVKQVLTFIGAHVGNLTHFAGGLSGLMVAVKVTSAFSGLFNLLKANPILLIVSLIAMLVIWLVKTYNTSKTFRDIVNGVFHAIAVVARWLWNNIFAPLFRFLINGFATVADWIGNMLDALGHIPGFGWARDAAAKMHGAAAAARNLASNIRDIPDGKSVSVVINTYYKTHGTPQPGAGNQAKGYASGGFNLPAGWAKVGEQGEELMYVPGGASIIPARQTAEILSGRRSAPSGFPGGGGSDRPIIVQFVAEGRLLQQVLLTHKRNTGGNLGLA